MRDVLFDTNILIDFFAEKPDAVEAVRSARNLFINPVVTSTDFGSS